MNIKKINGFTLVEISLVVSLILGLLVIMAIGISSYLKGADKVKCIQTMNSFGKTLQGYYLAAGIEDLRSVSRTEYEDSLTKYDLAGTNLRVFEGNFYFRAVTSGGQYVCPVTKEGDVSYSIWQLRKAEGRWSGYSNNYLNANSLSVPTTIGKLNIVCLATSGEANKEKYGYNHSAPVGRRKTVF